MRLQAALSGDLDQMLADEVRTLARRTQASTDEIQLMIGSLKQGAENAVSSMRTVQAATGTGVESSQRTGASLTAITGQVERISDMNHQVATATEEQSAVTEEINRSMVQIRHMVDELVQSGQASELNTRQLLEANSRVSAIMGRFKVS